MSTLGELLAEHTVLPGDAVDHLHAVVGEWQLLADLSFVDYLMWVRRDDDALVCVAQCRPNTAPTMLLTDAVGTVAGPGEWPQAVAAFESGHIGTAEAPNTAEAVPVRHGDAVVAVLTHPTRVNTRRKSSPLETAYLDCANDLLQMLSEGTFPNVGDLAMSRSSPRVGDGFIRLDVNGDVVFASPNAISAYHRMGLTSELEGHNLVRVTRPLISDPFEAQELAEHVLASLAGGSSMRLEVDAGGAAVLLRTLPLVAHHKPVGAAMLIRDVTEIKRRDRALLSKDATIREIHHRVKNNLQTVAALLRLQARRTSNPEGRDALIESVRRVSSIALVHDALSMSVDEEVNLDEVVDRILPIMNDVAGVDSRVRVERVGTLGMLDSDRATALIMVITELVQNAIEHAYVDERSREEQTTSDERSREEQTTSDERSREEQTTTAASNQGSVTIRAERSSRWLDLVVHDDGRGLPVGFSLEKSDRLGLQIVRTLVSTELDGSLGMHDAEGGGTDVVLRVPLGRRVRGAQ